ncbi:MAG: amidase, partial [Planctomycetota bacterium]
MSLFDLTATELLAELGSGKVTSVEVTQAFLDRIERHDGKIGAFLQVDAEGALEGAAQIDQKRRRGEPVGRLGGLPVALKDVLATRNGVTTCASRMLENFRPPYDATVVASLRAADAVLVGKANMDEFAMGGSTENSAFQITHNPWDPERVPGGSSGGA